MDEGWMDVDGWLDEWIFVGKWKRLSVDFRKLSQITKKISYPLPLIDNILAFLGKSEQNTYRFEKYALMKKTQKEYSFCLTLKVIWVQ